MPKTAAMHVFVHIGEALWERWAHYLKEGGRESDVSLPDPSVITKLASQGWSVTYIIGIDHSGETEIVVKWKNVFNPSAKHTSRRHVPFGAPYTRVPPKGALEPIEQEVKGQTCISQLIPYKD